MGMLLIRTSILKIKCENSSEVPRVVPGTHPWGLEIVEVVLAGGKLAQTPTHLQREQCGRWAQGLRQPTQEWRLHPIVPCRGQMWRITLLSNRRTLIQSKSYMCKSSVWSRNLACLKIRDLHLVMGIERQGLLCLLSALEELDPCVSGDSFMKKD